jgi:catalase
MTNKPGFDTDTGRGGETHQRVPKRGSHGAEGHLTTNQGIRVFANQNSRKAAVRGPTLLEDFVLREKIFHFDHERIPERIVHARGRIQVPDREGLEKRTCECYAVVKKEYDRILPDRLAA